MNDGQFTQLHICCPQPIPWPWAFLNGALKILLRQPWHWLLWGQHLTPSTQCILVCATASSDKCWTNYCMPSFIALSSHLCVTLHVCKQQRDSMLKRRGKVGEREGGGRSRLWAQRPEVAWRKRCWKQGGRGLAGWGPAFTGGKRWQPTDFNARRREMTVWHVLPHPLLQKSVLKGKGAQLMERATLMPWPKADGHATLSMYLCQRQQKDHRFG